VPHWRAARAQSLVLLSHPLALFDLDLRRGDPGRLCADSLPPPRARASATPPGDLRGLWAGGYVPGWWRPCVVVGRILRRLERGRRRWPTAGRRLCPTRTGATCAPTPLMRHLALAEHAGHRVEAGRHPQTLWALLCLHLLLPPCHPRAVPLMFPVAYRHHLMPSTIPAACPHSSLPPLLTAMVRASFCLSACLQAGRLACLPD